MWMRGESIAEQREGHLEILAQHAASHPGGVCRQVLRPRFVRHDDRHDIRHVAALPVPRAGGQPGPVPRMPSHPIRDEARYSGPRRSCRSTMTSGAHWEMSSPTDEGKVPRDVPHNQRCIPQPWHLLQKLLAVIQDAPGCASPCCDRSGLRAQKTPCSQLADERSSCVSATTFVEVDPRRNLGTHRRQRTALPGRPAN